MILPQTPITTQPKRNNRAALLMGGTGRLLNAGRAIIGASVGSGVAAGASTALGHSDLANVASGIIGGVTGRSVGRIV